MANHRKHLQEQGYIERPLTPDLKVLQEEGGIEHSLRIFEKDGLFIMVGWQGRWHLSASRDDRLPTWDELHDARYALLPDSATMAMILPPKSEYVNKHEYCFHLWEVGSK